MSYNYEVMYTRTINLSKTGSFFVFGARSTGKSTLINGSFPAEQLYTIDLLDPETEDRFSRSPSLLTTILDRLPAGIRYIFIDEVQKQPRLLSLVHQYLEKDRDRFIFILTGSSARKLKHGGADLLAGRAFVYHLYPLTFQELGDDFDLGHYLDWGGLPEVYRYNDIGDKKRLLRAYSLTYLKEEVWNEQLVRNLDPFRGFLTIAAQSSGDILNFTNIARQARVSTKTVQQYYDILCETHLGMYLEAWNSSARKRFINAPKFYLIDPGIKKALDNTLEIPLAEGTYAWGRAFEQFIITQCCFLNHYLQKDYRFFYIKTKDGAEVDLVIEKPGKRLILVEIKSAVRSETVSVRNLLSFSQDLKAERAIVLTGDPLARKDGDIEYLPWAEGLRDILL